MTVVNVGMFDTTCTCMLLFLFQRRDRYTFEEQSRITWDLLQQNNAKNTQPKYNRKSGQEHMAVSGAELLYFHKVYVLFDRKCEETG